MGEGYFPVLEQKGRVSECLNDPWSTATYLLGNLAYIQTVKRDRNELVSC